jgi:hypothetical protein
MSVGVIDDADLQVKLEVERNGGSARVQLRTRKDDKPLPQLPMEFTVPL